MTIHIRYRGLDNELRTFKHVRCTSVYCHPGIGASTPQLVLHFGDTLYPQVNIDLIRIESITTVDDVLQETLASEYGETIND